MYKPPYPTFMKVSLCTLILCFTACTSDPHTLEMRPTQPITGRAEEGKRFLVYRTPLITQWVRRDHLPEETLEDTKKSLCDFFIIEDGETVRISIHNFPSNNLEERIPPSAQLARWQQQLGYINPTQLKIEPQAFNGYCGLMLWAETSDSAILGWSLQLGQEHYRTLKELEEQEPVKRLVYKQMRADITIKATGSPRMIQKHAEKIIAFARTFELIEEIPTSS